MLQQEEGHLPGSEENSFGKLIFTWRGQIKRTKILAHLPGWSKDMFYRLEKGELAPAFDQLRPLYRALCLASVPLSLDGPQVYVKYARMRAEKKRTHLDQHTDGEWEELTYDLTLMDREFGRGVDRQVSGASVLNPLLLLDTDHLIGRESWRREMTELLTGQERRKIIAVVGPSGIGKTSEVNRLAMQLLGHNSHRPIICDFHLIGVQSPEEALDVFLGSVFSALGYAQTSAPGSLETRVMTLLEQVEKSSLPVVLVLDHAEGILQETGKLALCWERFFTRFLRYQHRATIIVATKQWPGWYTGELRYVIEKNIPALPQKEGALLLKHLGLESVPQSVLQKVSERVGGIPICLEWIAALAKRPFFSEEMDDAFPVQVLLDEGTASPNLTEAVGRLLEEPYIFGGTLAEEIAPLLEERILSDYHLTMEAQRFLQIVSLATAPLAKAALDVLYPHWMRVLPELRRACLLVSYRDRVHIVPSVAAALLRTLALEERFQQEEVLIEAYQTWLKLGMFYENEKGAIVTALTMLQISHRKLLAAAELLIRHGWMAFHLGYAIRLARLAQSARAEWETVSESERQNQTNETGAWLLHYFLSPYLGAKIDAAARAAHYHRLLGWIIDGTVLVEPPTELFVIRHLMFRAMDVEEFAQAQALVDACEQRLMGRIQDDPDLQASLLEKRGFLLTRWCEYAGEQQDLQRARMLREQVIAIYRQSITLLTEAEMQTTPLKSGILKKRLARAQTNLGFHLSRIGQFGEAIQVLKQSVLLKEKGYTEPGSLAASYGDLSQALLGLGVVQEALHYDELAMTEIQRLADAGDTVQQETAWTYRINRGRLYMKLGRLDEAEHLLQEAIPNLPERWRMFRVFGQEALDEIKRQRAGAFVPTQTSL